ncbi:unnamed protein product [Closterium sp. NIES-54]
MIHTHHQEHVMTNDNPEAGSSGTTSHVNHVHGNSLDGNLRPEMEWDGEQQQQQQQPISASMLMLQHYQNPGGLPTGWRDHFSSVISQQQHFFSSISQRQQHPVSLHDPRSSSSNHPGHPVPRPSGELFRPAVYSGAATSARESTRVMGAPSTLGAAIPVEATQDVSARAVAAHGEVLGASISAPERHQQQPTAGYPASASPAIAFPAMLQPRGPAASSAAASYMRTHGQMGSAVGGVGGSASGRATAVFQLQLPGFQLPERTRPPPPVVTHTWTGRTLPQPAASACSPAATAATVFTTATAAIAAIAATAPTSPTATAGTVIAGTACTARFPTCVLLTAPPGIKSFEDDSVSASSSFPYPDGFGGNTVPTGTGGGVASGRGGSVAPTAAEVAAAADMAAGVTAAVYCVAAAATAAAPHAGAVAAANSGGTMEMDSHHADNAADSDDADSFVASALDASALDASVLVASVLDASVLVASVLDASALDASALDASALDASALVASALDASVLVASALVASVLDASALDASVLDASALDASALGASALDASALDACLCARCLCARCLCARCLCARCLCARCRTGLCVPAGRHTSCIGVSSNPVAPAQSESGNTSSAATTSAVLQLHQQSHDLSQASSCDTMAWKLVGGKVEWGGRQSRGVKRGSEGGVGGVAEEGRRGGKS